MNFDVVVDNSALIEIVVSEPPDPGLLRRLMTSVAAAPEVIDAEALRVLRRMALKGRLTDEEATSALTRVIQSPIKRLPHIWLLDAAWRMRHAVSGHDSLYVALAERLDVPLVTCDAKLAGSNGHKATIEHYPTA
ncbi:type II toxin-antitoxin system VapC family toxin [Solihabitans fulvus]|uniref:Ribonuclease VapC n=1 Tax=Solihabitans fulvus TaxID=1892852 RepID=A0A5B2X0Y4_9PSEU|nr:type II toxin-antitoxin system VapC family toxin [Solihabitans fulvus]KAA2256137.1 type II toxin-antitoxin system VapC family toxin [Solihabitans fulvus]